MNGMIARILIKVGNFGMKNSKILKIIGIITFKLFDLGDVPKILPLFIGESSLLA
jgi:hypothetical protein